MIEKTYFTEEQQFTQVWIWILVGVSSAAALLPIFFTDLDIGTKIILVCAAALPLVLFSSMKLKTTVTNEGIYYRFYPFQQKDRHIPWADIDLVYSRTYKPIREYGGWGIRYGIRKVGKAYNVSGNQGLQIIFTNGKKLLIGTQRPEEIEVAVMEAMKAQ